MKRTEKQAGLAIVASAVFAAASWAQISTEEFDIGTLVTNGTAWSIDGVVDGDALGLVCTAYDWDDDGFYDVAIATRGNAGDLDAGYVKVLSGDDGTLLYTFKDTDTSEDTGFSVPYFGDEDGDGLPDWVAIGVSRWDSGDGKVFVFDVPMLPATSVSDWDFNADIKISAPTDEASGVGYNLDFGDFDNDGKLGLAIGAAKYHDPAGTCLACCTDGTADNCSDPDNDCDGCKFGAVYLVADLTDQSSTVTLSGLTRMLVGDNCGSALSIDLKTIGDNDKGLLGGDNGDEVALGQARYHGTPGGGGDEAKLGRVLIWDDAESESETIDRPDNGSCDTFDDCEDYKGLVCFGHRLDAGDTNKDGGAELIIGGGAEDAASIYKYNATTEGYTKLATIEPTGIVRFGRDVAFIGDVDGDGYGDFAVSDDEDEATKHGKVYIYSGRRLSDTEAPLYIIEGDIDNGRFGERMGGVGDINHDGVYDIGVAAIEYFVAGDQLGRVYGISMPTKPITATSTITGTTITEAGGPDADDIEFSDDDYYGIDSSAAGTAKLRVTFDASPYEALDDVPYIGLTLECHTVAAANGADLLVRIKQGDDNAWTDVVVAADDVDVEATDTLYVYRAIDNHTNEHINSSGEIVVEVAVKSAGADKIFEVHFDKVTLVLSPGALPTT